MGRPLGSQVRIWLFILAGIRYQIETEKETIIERIDMKYTDLVRRYKRETGCDADKAWTYDLWKEKDRWYIDIDDEDALALGQMIDNNDYSDYILWLEDLVMQLEKTNQ